MNELKTTRRKFLQLLGIAPVASVALKLDVAIAEVQEPTVEKIVNYVEQKRIVTGDDVIFLENVRVVNIYNQCETISEYYSSDHHKRMIRDCGRITIQYEWNTRMEALAMIRPLEHCFSFIIGSDRYMATGLLVSLGKKFDPNAVRQMVMQSDIELTAPVVVTPA